MDGIRVRDVGAVSPLDGLADLLRLFKAAREWSLEVDEQLRAEGHAPMGATLGMPAGQLDAIIVILERAAQQATACEAVRRRAVSQRRALEVVCGALVGLALLLFVARWI